MIRRIYHWRHREMVPGGIGMGMTIHKHAYQTHDFLALDGEYARRWAK